MFANKCIGFFVIWTILHLHASQGENWNGVCAAYPHLIAYNKYDSQRMYYLLIKANDLVLMEKLLRVDKYCKENIKEAAVYLFNRPVCSIGSQEVLDLIERYCLGEGKQSEWCVKCKEGMDLCTFCVRNNKERCRDIIPDNPEVWALLDALVEHVMANTMDHLQTLKSNLLAGVDQSFILDFFNQLFIFCSDNSREKLIFFLVSRGLDKECDILTGAMCRAMLSDDYRKAQYFKDHGADINTWTEYSNDFDQENLICLAISRVFGKDDYQMLIFLAENGAILDLNIKTRDRGFALCHLDQKKVQKVLPSAVYAEYKALQGEDLFASPLLYAVIEGNQKLVTRLLYYGAKVCVPQLCGDGDAQEDEAGENCPKIINGIDLLEIAKASGNQEITDAIVQAQETEGVNHLVDNLFI